jgi:ferredoxin
LKYHPDRNSSPVSENSIKIINAAFEVLSDKDKRRQYDEKLFNSIMLRRKKEDTESQPSSSHASSSTVYSDPDHNNNHDNYDNTYLRKGKKNVVGVKGGSSVEKMFGKTKGRYQITIEPSLCMAYGSCETLAPNVFEVDKNKILNPKATVKSETGNDFGSILDAAETCPTKAIIIRDRYTGRQIYP